MTGRIFISYRKADEPGFAGRMYDRLEAAFSAGRIFMDVANIKPGNSFARVLEEEVARCDVLLAIIGKGWLSATDERGRRRLENPDDWVLIEISAALAQGKTVIPVLVNGAAPLANGQLPHALSPLLGLQHVKISHETFATDAQALIRYVQDALEHIAGEQRREEAALKRQTSSSAAGRPLSKLEIDKRFADGILPKFGLRLVPRKEQFPSKLSQRNLAYILDLEEHRGLFLKDILRDVFWGFLSDEGRQEEFAAIKFKLWDPLESTCRHASLSIL